MALVGPAILLLPLGVVACAEPSTEASEPDGHDTVPGLEDSAPPLVGGIEEGGVRACPDPSTRAIAPLFAPPDPGDFAMAQPAASIGIPTGWGTSVADFDGDGHLDVLLPQHGAPQLFRGNGTGRLDLVGDAFPDADAMHAYGSSAVDVDGDGDLDVLLTRAGADVLWINDGTGHFSDGTEASGLGGDVWDSVHASWGDFDGDGDLDLFVANYWTEALHPDADEKGWLGDPNTLWENDGAGHFTQRSDFFDWRNASVAFTYVGAWWDVDGDLLPELYVVNDKGQMGYENALLRYDDGVFTAVGEGSGVDLSMQGMGLGAGDLNRDDVPDFLVSDWGELRMLVSDGAGGWYDAALASGLDLPLDDERIVAWGAELEDLDDDGDHDLFVSFGNDNLFSPSTNENGVDSQLRQYDGVWLQGDDGRFSLATDTWHLGGPGVGRGFALADLDGNGWLDIVRRDIVEEATVDMQACGAEGWLGVQLAGPAPNTFGVGARIEVEAGGERRVRWIHAGSTNIASGSATGAHVGLGSVDTVDTLRVRWPDGAVQEFHDIAARQRVRVWRE